MITCPALAGSSLIKEVEVVSKLTRFPSLCFSEIEAKEACDWLRAAGFPQYAQLYEGRLGFSSVFIKRINLKNIL